jgi:hypothetical protein
MNKEKVIQGVIDYFRSDQWRRVMAFLVQDPEPQGTHAHVYVQTCADPLALQKVIETYFIRKGYPIMRRIDLVSPKEGLGSLHGIEPKGLPHFDWNWFYNPDVSLAATDGGKLGESGCNFCGWNRTYMTEFYRDFPFRTVGSAEEKTLRSFFQSDFWHKGLEVCTRPTTNHLHINCYTSVHPDVIQKFAEESIREKGWEIFYTCPNVYIVDGKYTGKLVFMGKKPEAVYDLGWKFKADVIIAPATDPWVWKNNVGHDVWTQDVLDKVLALPYVKLDESDVSRIIDAIV